MIWEVEITPRGPDLEKSRVEREYALLAPSANGGAFLERAVRGFLLESAADRPQVERFAKEVLVDGLAETGRVATLDADQTSAAASLTVLLKPGVMDPVAESVLGVARDLGFPLDEVRTFRRYVLEPSREPSRAVLKKILANDAIEQLVEGRVRLDHLGLGSPYALRVRKVPLREMNSDALLQLSRDGQLALNVQEMLAIQAHFREIGRDPTDVELETLAQTWSEHCSHKTLKGPIDFDGRRIDNLLKETIFGATQQIRREQGDRDWCVSVFEDNAGVVRFTDDFHVCFKVETHNHPSAIEPYGGANTGLGGVIRDPMGTGLGARPIASTDVFCFAPPDTPPEAVPPGVLHPQQIMNGVVAGVRDYGNRMGIPTVNGAVCFDPRYLGNPLVFCGNVGLIPVDRCHKHPKAGDRIVVVGGRTGRDGIHGATFSSIELTAESEQVSGGAVQIGNAIAEKKVLDVILQARDLGLYRAITDCGAGGLSSAIGEMGAELGADVHLERVPLKYQGLSYTEIWISESQERMVLAVPEENWLELQDLCRAEDVEATELGQFQATGRLRLAYEGEQVADLSMHFLHDGRPAVVRKATWSKPAPQSVADLGKVDYSAVLQRILSSWNVCSKEWIIRRYDHEVQGGTILKPLVGTKDDGPGDAAVLAPVLGCETGLAIGCGINPCYGDLDPYRMAAAAVDEAVRNVVAVGADPARIALLDNFCWGNTDRPEVLGSLVLAAEACRDAALAYGMPFISGKDSLNNEYKSGERRITIPPTLLISALGQVADVRKCVTMDLKEPGNVLVLLGATRDEMGGSHFNLVAGRSGDEAPIVDLKLAPLVFRGLHQAIQRGLVRSCHDLSEGGLAVAVAEMAFAGNVGADITDLKAVGADLPDEVALFSESQSRFLLEVRPDNLSALRECLGATTPHAVIGKTCKETRLRIADKNGEWLLWASLDTLKSAWKKPLDY